MDNWKEFVKKERGEGGVAGQKVGLGKEGGKEW